MTRKQIDRMATAGLLVALVAGMPSEAAAARSATRPPATAAITAAVTPVAQAQTPAPDLVALRAVFQRAMAAGAPGVMARIDDGARVYRMSAGTGDLTTHKRIDPDGQFRVGSVTKTFSTVVAMQLVAEGRLALDRPVNSYLPGALPDNSITVRHLLSHRSGLFDYTNPMFDKTVPGFEAVRDKVFTLRELLGLSLQHPLDFTPGSRFGYSNTNFVVVGMLIEKVTGDSLQHQYQALVIQPLGLRHTFYIHPATGIPGLHAHGYLTPDDRTQPLDDSTEQTASWAQSAGAMISNGADLNRFFSALLSGRLVRPDLLDQMETDGALG